MLILCDPLMTFVVTSLFRKRTSALVAAQLERIQKPRQRAGKRTPFPSTESQIIVIGELKKNGGAGISNKKFIFLTSGMC